MKQEKIKELFIVGLGNPGEEYENTRHNTGRIINYILVKKFEVGDFEYDKKINGEVVVGKVGKVKTTFLNPDTFMNKSGDSVSKVIKNKKQALGLVIIHDDLDLPIGRAKMSFAKNSGGHRGVESIIKKIKTEEFLRVRVGISPISPSGKIKKPTGEKNVEKTILGKFSDKEFLAIKNVGGKTYEALLILAEKWRESAVCFFNSAF